MIGEHNMEAVLISKERSHIYRVSFLTCAARGLDPRTLPVCIDLDTKEARRGRLLPDKTFKWTWLLQRLPSNIWT